jgi:hypothetical protein
VTIFIRNGKGADQKIKKFMSFAFAICKQIFNLTALFANDYFHEIKQSRVTRTVDSERLWSGIEELGLLIELLNFQVEIPTLKCSNSTMKVCFSSPLQGKTTESHNSPTT